MKDLMSQVDTDLWEHFLHWLVYDKNMSGKFIISLIVSHYKYQEYWDEFQQHWEEL